MIRKPPINKGGFFFLGLAEKPQRIGFLKPFPTGKMG